MQAEQNINQEGFAAWQDKSIPGHIPLGKRLFHHNTAMAVKRHLRPLPEQAVRGGWHRLPFAALTWPQQLPALSWFPPGRLYRCENGCSWKDPWGWLLWGDLGEEKGECCLCLEQLGQGPKSEPGSCIPGREHMRQGWTEEDWPWVNRGDTEVHRCLFP